MCFIKKIYLMTKPKMTTEEKTDERESFRTFHTERFENGHTWISMEKL